MKKVSAFLLAMIMIGSLASCGDGGEASSAASSTAVTVSRVTSTADPIGADEITYEKIGEGSTSRETTATFNDVHVIGVEMEKETVTLLQGKKVALKAEVTPSNAKDKGLFWKSSNEATAKVDKDGNVLGMAPGCATITAISYDYEFKATCTVCVVNNEGDSEKIKAAVDAINAARKEANVKELNTKNFQLNSAANQRAYEEAIEGKMDDKRPDGRDAGTIYTDYQLWTRYSGTCPGYWGSYTADQYISSLLKSDSTKKELLSDKYTDVAVGYISRGGVDYWLVLLMAEN